MICAPKLNNNKSHISFHISLHKNVIQIKLLSVSAYLYLAQAYLFKFSAGYANKSKVHQT